MKERIVSGWQKTAVLRRILWVVGYLLIAWLLVSRVLEGLAVSPQLEKGVIYFIVGSLLVTGVIATLVHMSDDGIGWHLFWLSVQTAVVLLALNFLIAGYIYSLVDKSEGFFVTVGLVVTNIPSLFRMAVFLCIPMGFALIVINMRSEHWLAKVLLLGMFVVTLLASPLAMTAFIGFDDSAMRLFGLERGRHLRLETLLTMSALAMQPAVVHVMRYRLQDTPAGPPPPPPPAPLSKRA